MERKLDLERKCGFCRWYEQNGQKQGYCRWNPPLENKNCDIVVKMDRLGCSAFKLEEGFILPKKDKK